MCMYVIACMCVYNKMFVYSMYVCICSSVEERHCRALELNYQSINHSINQSEAYSHVVANTSYGTGDYSYRINNTLCIQRAGHLIVRIISSTCIMLRDKQFVTKIYFKQLS